MYNQFQTTATPGAILHDSVDARARFIFLTYLHLVGAILTFTCVEMAIFTSGAAQGITNTLMSLPGGWLVVIGGFVLVSWFATRLAHNVESKALQYAALAMFVGAEAIIFVPLLYMANQYYSGVIGIAAAFTIVAFIGLTGIVFVTRKDFSFLRGLLMWIGLCAMVAIVLSLIMGFTLGPWFSALMVCFAGAAILYDTSKILHHYPRDRYVGASLELFASVAMMFWYVLRLFMQARD